jgi:hypothetical protein
VADDLSVHVFGDLAGEAHSHSDDLSSVKTWEIAEDGIGTTMKLVMYPIERERISLPRAVQDVRPDQNQLSHNAQDVQVGSVGEEEVP